MKSLGMLQTTRHCVTAGWLARTWGAGVEGAVSHAHPWRRPTLCARECCLLCMRACVCVCVFVRACARVRASACALDESFCVPLISR